MYILYINVSLFYIYIYIYMFVLGGGTLWHLQKCSHYIKYIIFELMPSTILHHPPPHSIPGIVSTDIIFPFTYMYIQYLHHIHLSSPFPYLFPCSHWHQAKRRRKKWYFWLFNIDTQGDSLCTSMSICIIPQFDSVTLLFKQRDSKVETELRTSWPGTQHPEFDRSSGVHIEMGPLTLSMNLDDWESSGTFYSDLWIFKKNEGSDTSVSRVVCAKVRL
jgi:hypothetical protein